MSNFKIIHNVQSDEIQLVELSEEEKQKQIEDEIIANQRLEREVELAAAKTVLLQKLGITEEEAKLLLS